MLTYNNLALTKDCLDSLETYSDDVDLEVVIVDNASSDGSPAYLSSWSASRPNAKLILNRENRGFAAGNNQGLAAASGDYLVILNNDTVVTRGWARRMINHLRNAPEIGILGPLTNNIGNEARVDTRYTKLDAMHHEAEEITERNLAGGSSSIRSRSSVRCCRVAPMSDAARSVKIMASASSKMTTTADASRQPASSSHAPKTCSCITTCQLLSTSWEWRGNARCSRPIGLSMNRSGGLGHLIGIAFTLMPKWAAREVRCDTG